MRKGWEYKKLGEVCEVVTGTTPKTNIPEYWGKGHYWVTPAELNDTTVYIDKTERQITDEALSKTKLRLLPVGTVLLSSRAPIGKVAIANAEMYCNQGFKNCICSEAIYNKYLFYFLRLKKDYLNSLGRGATFKEISKSIVESIKIPLPPLSTQLAIVSELDKINELIRLKKEQLKDFDNLAQSLFYEMFGDPVENEKGWEVKKLGEICTDITDGDHMPPPKSEFGIPFITISDIDKDTRCLNFENTFYVPEDYYNNLKENRKPQKGDLLYTVTGTYGIPVIVKTNKKFCFQRHIALLRPNKEILSTIFLCYWVLSDGVKFMADKVATGIAQKTVGLNSIRKFSCILPPLPLQQLFAQRIEQIEREKSEVQKSIQDLETLLASRMQYWFE